MAAAGGLTAAVDLQFHGDGLGKFRLFLIRELAGGGQHEGDWNQETGRLIGLSPFPELTSVHKAFCPGAGSGLGEEPAELDYSPILARAQLARGAST
jgi:hypothetical protein